MHKMLAQVISLICLLKGKEMSLTKNGYLFKVCMLAANFVFDSNASYIVQSFMTGFFNSLFMVDLIIEAVQYKLMTIESPRFLL